MQNSQWLGFLLIITFSTAIMVLFIYTASSLHNENSNPLTNLIVVAIPIIVIYQPTEKPQCPVNQQAANFSNSLVPLTLILLLMGAMVGITFMASNPILPINSYF